MNKSSLGYVCPATYNPSDFYIQTLAVLPNNRQETLQRSRYICNAYDQSQFGYSISQQIAQIESTPIHETVKKTRHT